MKINLVTMESMTVDTKKFMETEKMQKFIASMNSVSDLHTGQSVICFATFPFGEGEFIYVVGMTEPFKDAKIVFCPDEECEMYEYFLNLSEETITYHVKVCKEGKATVVPVIMVDDSKKNSQN